MSIYLAIVVKNSSTTAHVYLIGKLRVTNQTNGGLNQIGRCTVT